MSKFIHETAIVDKTSLVGSGTKIWHWCHLSKNVKLGEDCVLGQNVYVGDNVAIGNNVKIQNNVSIYTGVTLEDDVFCGPSMVFTNVINPRATINKKSEFKKTVVKKGASIGANATIICGVTIGKYSFIGAGSVVTKKVKDYALVVGNPAVQTGWVNMKGNKLDLPLQGYKQIKDEDSKNIYTLKDGVLKIE
jgi:UDP-2-acetamido-3-amino-2,3-dideoxy-glucuronate N-acetyltransferase